MSAITRASSDEKLIQMWLHNRPQATVVSYSHTVTNFLDFVNKPLSAIAIEDLQAYVTYLHAQNLKESSIRTKLNAIKSLFSFAAKLNYIRFNISAALKMPKSNYSLAGRVLKQSDVLKLIK